MAMLELARALMTAALVSAASGRVFLDTLQAVRQVLAHDALWDLPERQEQGRALLLDLVEQEWDGLTCDARFSRLWAAYVGLCDDSDECIARHVRRVEDFFEGHGMPLATPYGVPELAAWCREHADLLK